MVEEIKGQNQPGQGQSASRGRWGDIYASMPVKKMIALYDYDPHELSPNVDSVSSLKKKRKKKTKFLYSKNRNIRKFNLHTFIYFDSTASGIGIPNWE